MKKLMRQLSLLLIPGALLGAGILVGFIALAIKILRMSFKP
jgi:hypothetical protein